MPVILIFLQVLIFNAISLHAAMRDRLNFNESNATSDLTIHVVKKCFLHGDSTVAVIGDVPEMILKKLHLPEIAATASIGLSRTRSDGMYGKLLYSKSIYRQAFWIRLQRVVHTFVVASPSEAFLREALKTARTSVWWYSAAFFIVTNTNENDNCRNASNYLWTLWQAGILYSIFLCKDNDGILAIYGYSPYYDGHGRSWRKVQVHAQQDGHPWALLKLKQVHDTNICDTIAFDKVNRLDGHPIHIGALSIPPMLVINDGREEWFDKHVGEDAMIIHTIWKALNGSIRTVYYKGKNPIGFNGENESYTGFMADLSSGKIDHGMNGMWADLQWRIKFAYPHAETSANLLTPSRGNIPNWMRLLNMYETPVIVGINVTLLIGTIFIRFVEHRPWSVIILEILRVVFSVAMVRLPKKLSSQLLWITIFIVLLVMTSCFQGLLISLLTKPIPHRNIDGIDDVLDVGYMIYGYPPFKTFFEETKLSNQFRLDNMKVSCFNLVAQGHPIACISDYMYLKTILTIKTHISKESIACYYTSYITKLDWPLYNRFNNLVQRLFRAGITSYWRQYFLNQITITHWAEIKNNFTPNLKVLSVADLAFVFHILIAGLLFSFTVFVIELIMHRAKH